MAVSNGYKGITHEMDRVVNSEFFLIVNSFEDVEKQGHVIMTIGNSTIDHERLSYRFFYTLFRKCVKYEIK